MNMKPLKAAARSGAARPRKGIADQPDPLPGPGAARDGAARPNAGREARLRGLEFPGCKPVRMTREDIASFEGRLEFWDADASTAWICEPTSPYHERPSRRLARLAERIALVRGALFESYGHMDLQPRDRKGEAHSIMQADESLCLHPAKVRLPGASAMIVGETSQIWCWKWTTARTCAGASSSCTNPGASRRSGWRCRSGERRAAPEAACRG